MTPEQEAKFRERLEAEEADPRFIERLEAEQKAISDELINPLYGVGAGLAVAYPGGRLAKAYVEGKQKPALGSGIRASMPPPPEVVAKGPDAVENWAKTQHQGQYYGGDDYSSAHKKAMTVKEAVAETPGYKAMSGTGLIAPREAVEDLEAKRIAEERRKLPISQRIAEKSPRAAKTASGAANILRKGVPPFMGRTAAGGVGGYSAAEAYNRGVQGDVPGAAISGAGALGGLLSLSPNPKTRALGILGMGASLLGNQVYDSPTVSPDSLPPNVRSVMRGYAAGSAVKGAKGGLEALKKAFAPKPTKVQRASEALGPHEGKYLHFTESDRMRSTGGDLGGPGFSRFQLEDPRYAEAEAAWGVASKPKASSILNINKRFPEGKSLWTPLIGAEGQHRSNQHVYDMLQKEFSRQASMGKLKPELRESMNKRLNTLPQYKQANLEGIDVANPETLQQFGNTFDRRAAIAEVLGGQGVGGRKGQIFDYPGIMQEMSDPMTLGAPTHSAGTRLFTLNNEMDYRPDLHSAFPYILKGQDQGVAFNPVPKELAFKDWIDIVKDFTGREPGYMEFARGVKQGQGRPHQFIDERFLRRLEDAGHKAGGLVGADQ